MPPSVKVIIICSCGRRITFVHNGAFPMPPFVFCRKCKKKHMLREKEESQ